MGVTRSRTASRSVWYKLTILISIVAVEERETCIDKSVAAADRAADTSRSRWRWRQTANAQAPRFRALVFSETAGFVHDSVPEARQLWTELAAQHDFEVVQAQDSTPFTDEGLRDFDVIILAQASGDVWNAAEQEAFERYVRAGGGVHGDPQPARHGARASPSTAS